MRRHLIRSVSSKLIKTRALMRNRLVKRYIPVTRAYNKATLRSMLGTYRMVYVKPDTGTGGRGVIKVLKRGRVYEYRLQRSARAFVSFKRMSRSLARYTSRRAYLVQRGIHLLRFNSRPFDLRIMVQLNPRKRWVTTGMVGRTASRNKIVTNICQGGYPLPVHTILSRYFKKRAHKFLFIRSLRRVGRLAASQLGRTYPRLKEIGVDVGIDYRKKPWIIEINTRPSIYGFRMLKNKSIYRKILRYSRSNGRRLRRQKTKKA